jgi:hypothetical protein
MGEEREGFVETRIIRGQLKFEFAGAKTAVFKPGMPFEGHVYVMYDDDQALSSEKLAGATITLRPVVTSSNGQLKTLPEMTVPAKDEYINHQKDESQYTNEFDNWMEHQMNDVKFSQFRATGVHSFRVCRFYLSCYCVMPRCVIIVIGFRIIFKVLGT